MSSQIGRELGVRYVLEGSVRKAANRVRIAGQLIDASAGTNIWADRFEGAVDDIFKLQDQMTASVVGALSPKLEEAEIDRALRKPTESLDAYDIYLRAMASFYRRSNDANNEALRLFYKAIEIDPDFASAHGMAAWCYAWRKLNGWMVDPSREFAEAIRLARRAVALGTDDAVALTRAADVLALVAHDLDSSIVLFDRALLLNPNLAIAWYMSGWKRAYRGELDVAIENLARAMRLSPLDPTQYHMQVGMAFAHFLWATMTMPVHGWRRHFVLSRTIFPAQLSPRRATRWLDAPSKRIRPWRSSARLIPRCGWQTSRIGFRFGDRKILPGGPKAYETRVYQSELEFGFAHIYNCYVAYWHLADNAVLQEFVRCRSNSGHGVFISTRPSPSS